MASVRFRQRLLISCVRLFSLACAASEHAVLERGNGPEPSTLDAHRCQEVSCANILRDLYEGLVSEDAAGNLIPGLAVRWQVTPEAELRLDWTETVPAHPQPAQTPPQSPPAYAARTRIRSRPRSRRGRRNRN